MKTIQTASLFTPVLGILLCMGCHPNSHEIDANIQYTPSAWQVEKIYTTNRHNCIFPPLSKTERAQEWGRELYLGKKFAQEMDFYRALTCFKRALFLHGDSPHESSRLLEIEYEIVLTYYLAGKYQDAIEIFEMSHLNQATESFSALEMLTTLLYECYERTGHIERAEKMLNFIQKNNPEQANQLILSSAIAEADFEIINAIATHDDIYGEIATTFLCDYSTQAKSVSKAQFLNAALPGAGYLYVGQAKTALTSLIINGLFIAAAYQLFDRGYVPAGLIISSLEIGWYFGGINGAGLAAKEYNERLYEGIGREALVTHKLFPILTIQKCF